MPNPPDRFTVVGLIQAGIEGKEKALAGYDGMLWRIRTGYAAVLYGAFTLALGLFDVQSLQVSPGTAAAVAVTLVTGFTVCAAALDFAFLRSKLQVVQTKEALVELALLLASGGSVEQWQGAPVGTLLQNSGERLGGVDWTQYPAGWPVAVLYVGTWGFLCGAVLILLAGP